MICLGSFTIGVCAKKLYTDFTSDVADKTNMNMLDDVTRPNEGGSVSAKSDKVGSDRVGSDGIGSTGLGFGFPS